MYRVVRGSTWTWLWGRSVYSSLNCFPGAGVSQRWQVSLWAHLPFSLMPLLSSPSCDLLPEEPRHMCVSLEQGHSCHSLEQVCSLHSVFTQCDGNSIYVWQLTKCKSLREAWMKSVLSIFPRTNERLAEVSTKLEVEKQQNRSLLSSLSSTPVLEPFSVGNFSPTSGFNANLISRAIVGFSTSIPHRSNDSVETYLTKVSSFLFFPLGFRFLI